VTLIESFNELKGCRQYAILRICDAEVPNRFTGCPFVERLFPSYCARRRNWNMTLTEIFEQLPKLTPDEKRQLRNVLDRELASESEQDESPEFLAELDRCVREAEAGGQDLYS
jgi:hypothetical protein